MFQTTNQVCLVFLFTHNTPPGSPSQHFHGFQVHGRGILIGMFKGIFKMFQQSFQGIIKSPPPLNFIFKGIFKMMMMMMVGVVVMVVAQVAKLCVARWKPWSWTCAFRPTKHSVFWCLDTQWTSARANGGFAPKITPDMFLDYIIIIHHVIIYIVYLKYPII